MASTFLTSTVTFLVAAQLASFVCAQTTVVQTLSTLSFPEPTQSAASQWEDDTAFQDAVLNSTNTYRHQHNVTLLSWNDSLAKTASDWANDCNWEHSGGPTGENLASGYANVTAAIEGWGNERRDYNFRNGDFSMSTGHFTQLVWANTTSVGCGRKDCGDSDGDEGKAFGWFFVCEYWPPGNYANEYQEMVPAQENSDPSPDGSGDVTTADSAAVSVETQRAYALFVAMVALIVLL